MTTRLDRLFNVITRLSAEVSQLLEESPIQAVREDLEDRAALLSADVEEVKTRVAAITELGATLVDDIKNNALSKPSTFTISGGQSTYVVSHNLGYKPMIFVFDSADVEVKVLRTHVSDNTFAISGLSLAFTGTIVYH